MGDGQSLLGHRQSGHDLGPVAAVVAWVAILGQLTDPVALEVSRGEVVEDQSQGQAEQVGGTVSLSRAPAPSPALLGLTFQFGLILENSVHTLSA